MVERNVDAEMIDVLVTLNHVIKRIMITLHAITITKGEIHHGKNKRNPSHYCNTRPTY